MIKVSSAMSNTKQKTELKKPSGARIILVICGCYAHEKLLFFVTNKQQISAILSISGDELEAVAKNGMFTAQPQVVGCYVSLDIAETKLIQLRKVTPFIDRACHNFFLIAN